MKNRIEDNEFKRMCLKYIDHNNISQAEFARRSGVGKATIHKYLSGARGICFKKKEMLSIFLSKK